MLDWKPSCHRRKRHFKSSLILSRTRALRLSLSLQMSHKSFCSSSGTLSRRSILDIFLRVKGVNFTDVPDDGTTLAFLIKLGYKGPLYKHTNMFVDHMHHPWRTLAAIISKCLSGKTTSNEKLRKSIIDILRRYQDVKTCHSPDSSKSSSITSSSNTESYQMFIKYSICHIPLKRSKGKGSQRKKTADDSQETIDVSEEFKPEPKPIKRKTTSRRVVMKKVTIFAADNIIPEPDVTLELGTRGSSEGIGTIPGVLDESIIVSATSSEGSGTKPREKTNLMMKNKECDVDHESDDHISDTQDTDDEDDETESDEDEIYKYKIRVRKDEDEEMLNAEVEYSGKGDAQVSDAAKAAKDDSKKAKLPPTSFSLSISSSFGDQFLKLSFDISLVGTVKDTTDAEITSLLDINIQYEVPHIQSPSVLRVQKIDLSAEALAALKTQVPSVVDNYLGSKVRDVFQKEVKKHTANLKCSLQQIPELPKHQTPTVDLEQEYEKIPSYILKIKKEQAEKQKMPEFTIKSTDKVALKEYDQKSALYQTMHANKSYNRNLANYRLYHALMEALIVDENAMDKGVADTEPVEEPIADVVMDDASDDVVRDDNQPQDVSEPNTTKTLNPEWFTQPLRPSTPDPKNKRDRYPIDSSKALPLQGHPGHLTVAANYFFNNDLEYLKSSDLKRTYTTSITKTKATRYEIEWIEDMVPMLWSPTKVGYDKDTLKEIKD
uniref:Uncharacterized protein n=1 Tax=Tanacetum cinerariifolium TaxID=118510 RepID=A0A6L2KU57_TANCI|nr:hypothetical protein [Tanacetum cinerariifolium]